jgi:hypothetical protein
MRVGATEPLILKDVKTDWALANNKVEFTISHGNEVLVIRSYSASNELASLNDNPTPFVEAEDCDFFLFTYNVLSDQEHANRIYRAEFKDSP